TEEVLDTLIKMGLIEPVSDMTPVRRLISFLLEKFTEKPVDFQAFAEIKSELYVMFEQQPFRLPAQMTFILKSLTTLDGVARALDPQYNLVAAAQPFIKSIAVSKGRGSAIGELARQTKNFITYKLQHPSKTEVLIRDLERRIEDGELQLRVRSIESDRIFKRIYLAIKSLVYACLTGFTLLAGAILFVEGFKGVAVAAFTLSALALLFLVRSLVSLAMREKLDSIAEK
ncbi:MAG TPA: AarF/ABC1/UbiB kinase family protein, partial [Kamptonema sp.]|nr:AarF/ABC1/UbiB kinase family protein [Kamptonema sp.]